jgi:hypothetical protein
MNEELIKKAKGLISDLYDVFSDLAQEAEDNNNEDLHDFFADKFMTCDEMRADLDYRYDSYIEELKKVSK